LQRFLFVAKKKDGRNWGLRVALAPESNLPQNYMDQSFRYVSYNTASTMLF
jgi:hypothetical protein